MPEPGPNWIPPWGLGSGNADRPWLRMHSEKARNDPFCDGALGPRPDEPHAPIATAHAPAVNDASSRGDDTSEMADMLGFAIYRRAPNTRVTATRSGTLRIARID